MQIQGGLFLFSDVLLLSKCVRRNCRYVNEVVIPVTDPSLFISRDGARVEVRTTATGMIRVRLQSVSEAVLWEKYILFWRAWRHEE